MLSHQTKTLPVFGFCAASINGLHGVGASVWPVADLNLAGFEARFAVILWPF
jgi:hypothetical protein